MHTEDCNGAKNIPTVQWCHKDHSSLAVCTGHIFVEILSKQY